MKYLLVVCDGMADIGRTPLMTAQHPGIDFLCKNGKCGLIDLEYKKIVDSDIGFLKLLGSFDERYPGRGYLELLGAGANCEKNDVCIRANFATMDGKGILRDRRAGRDETGLEELAKELNGICIDDVEFTVRKSSGHRLVIILTPMKGKLSPHITSNDPKKVGVPLQQIKPKTTLSKRTANVLNKFLRLAHKILQKHPVNKERKKPANFILIRNTGKKKDAIAFKKRFKLNGCCIGGVNIVKGVATFLGMDFIKPEGATGRPDTDLNSKLLATLNALKKYDFIMLHVNGFDELSHDHKNYEKGKFIEKFDKIVIKKLLDFVDLNDTVIIITSDHRTASKAIEGYEHLPNPVPVCMCGDKIPSDNVMRFDENSVLRGSLRIRGNNLLPTIFKLAK